MKKLALTAKVIALALASSMVIASCSGNKTDNSAAPVAAADSASTATGVNFRYIDGDSLTSKYNLAKDFNEAYIRSLSKLENARLAKANEIQRFANQVEQKAKAGGYLSETTYNADLQKLQKMQQDAEAYLANLSRTAESELAQQQLQLHDSIENYIKIYNATRGYDAILLKQAGLYFNPALDITNEIVDGLNARYNKVEESK